jgi:hypothetical protein
VAGALLVALWQCGGGGSDAADTGSDSGAPADLVVDSGPSDTVAEAGPDLAGSDTGAVDDAAGDAGPGDAKVELEDVPVELVPEVVEEIEPADLGPMPPATQVEEPVKVAIDTWLVTYVPDPAKDIVGPALDAGTFVAPTGPGKDASGVEWVERKTGENGSLGYAGYSLFYAVAVVKLDAPRGIIVRADRFYQAYVNNAPQPGDPYMSRSHRTPAPGLAGDNVVVGAAYMAVNDPEIEVLTTGSEVFFNALDITSPDLPVGQEATQWLGIPLLNLKAKPLKKMNARVLENDYFEATSIAYPSLAPAAVTQIAFELKPKAAATEAGESWPVHLLVESHSLDWSYETEVQVPTVAAGAAFRRTRLSRIDGSVQYYGVNPPSGEAPAGGHAVVLSLHGAGVQGIGQAQAYGPKDWAYVVAPTNRRPFGFDWEEWGRVDGIEAFEDALASFPIDPTRAYVSGHSMGGHGTWQFGVHYSGRFRVAGPSAGWSSFYSYGGSQEPTGPFARARASSFTLNYVENLSNRAVYVIHGDKDDNVPISEAYLMQAAVEPVADEFWFHVEPGAGHWWDGPLGAGADCVDWPPLFDIMKERALDPAELTFTYRSPGPWVNGRYSFVAIQSQIDPYSDATVDSIGEGDTVTVTTGNVRGMVLDGAALTGKGVKKLLVDGKDVALADGPIAWGEQSGKTPAASGPLNQVFHRPFCFVYDPGANPLFQRYVSYLVSTWTIIGNGHACALTVKSLTDEIRKEYNLVYVGVSAKAVPVPDGIPFSWTPAAVTVAGNSVEQGTLLFVFPEEGHLSAALVAAEGAESLLYWEQPFSSRSGLPDYTGWTAQGVYTAGFFDGDWKYDPAYGVQ